MTPQDRATDFVWDCSMWLEDCVLKRPMTDLEKKWLGTKFRFHTEKPLRWVTPEKED